MPGITAALKKLLHLRSVQRKRRRQARSITESVESLESRILLSAVSATTEISAEVQICTDDACATVDLVDDTSNSDQHDDSCCCAACTGEVADESTVEHDSSCCCAACTGDVHDHEEDGDHHDHLDHAVPLNEEALLSDGDYDGSGTVADLSQTFFLHSNPGASHTIYLDFDGHVTSGTHWNSTYNGGEDIITPAFTLDGDSSSFSDAELTRIQRIWQRVAEDFLPFDVNVTTEDPGSDALIKSGNGDSEWGIRVVIGGTSSWYTSNVAGVARRDSFNYSTDTPTFVFSASLSGAEKYTADVISHEVGHTLGLAHDGGPGTSYYGGHGSGETSWVPLMGLLGTNKNLTQWSNGDYAGATNTQDDLEIITTKNGFGYRTDDYGDSAGTAYSFLVVANTVDTSGIIEQNTDVDVFEFTTDAGTINLTASAAAIGPNLDILLELYDASGNLVATANPSDQLGATLSVAVTAGTYYLHVSGTGKGDPLNGGYSDYGSLGFYSISGTLALPDTTGPRVISSSASGATAGTLDTFTLTFSEAIADGTFAVADVTLTGPGGAIAPTAVNKITSTQYEVTFAPQTAVGTYTLTVGPQIADGAGNLMDQDQDGVAGEASQDQYTTSSEVYGAGTGEVQVIDDGEAGFSTAGVWKNYLDASANDGDAIYSQGSVGSATANWTFENLEPGTYLVSATWTVNSAWATDAPFTVLDGSTSVGTYNVNQELAPADFTDNAGVPWHNLGTFEITGDTLVVRLTNAANGMVSADAVRIERLGAATPDTTGPRVISSSSSGASAGTLDTFTLTFSEPIADGTFTTADVSLSGPAGAIAPTAVNKLSSTQYEVTFAPQTAVGTYTLTVGPDVTDVAGNLMDQDQDGTNGEATDDQFSTTASIADTTGPRVISSSASGATAGTLDTFTLTFSEAIADGTFTVADVTLTGPGGAIAPTAVNKITSTQYEVTFAPQTAVGTYTLTVGPQIEDGAGNLMDQDQDGLIGELADDQFTTTAVILEEIGPQVISASSSGAAPDTLDTFTLAFSEPIADGTFTSADVSLTGPNGAITSVSVNKLSSTEYEVTFAPQATLGTYTLAVGPQITDQNGNLMDQDQDGTNGEATDDQFSTTASIADTTGPRVVSSSASGATAGTLDTFTLTFSEPIADGTFTTADVTLTGPGGSITPTFVTKLSDTQYEVTFATQSAIGTYTLTVAPQLTDVAGNLMDQDQDGTGGEAADDQYSATAEILDTSGPQVVSSSWSGATAGTLDTVTLTFSESIADSAFTLADVSLTGPGGPISLATASINKISSTQYEVVFAPHSAVGVYTLTIGPHIEDVAGNAMDQDQDGTTGESVDDQYTTAAEILDTSGPQIVNSFFTGATAGTLDAVTLTFSEAIADGTFTLADISLAGPNGAIAISAVNKLSDTEYEVTFAPQSVEGIYTLTVSPQLTDTSGNLMDQDQDGTGGEAGQDDYTASTVLEAPLAEWHFDFGSSSSPVATGYQQVTESTSYNNSLGYGWTSGRVRNKARGGDALHDDFNWSKDATFGVDVPDGTYDVTISLGDSRGSLSNVAVHLEGAQVDTVSTADREVVSRTYRVVVTDGQLTLRLSDGYFAITSLSIVSSATVEAASLLDAAAEIPDTTDVTSESLEPLHPGHAYRPEWYHGSSDDEKESSILLEG